MRRKHSWESFSSWVAWCGPKVGISMDSCWLALVAGLKLGQISPRQLGGVMSKIRVMYFITVLFVYNLGKVWTDLKRDTEPTKS